MADKYKPESLKEDAAMKQTIVNTAIDIQSVLQLLIHKEIITLDELNEMREKVKTLPKYKASLQYIQNINNAADLYEKDPQAYLKALFNEKLNNK